MSNTMPIIFSITPIVVFWIIVFSCIIAVRHTQNKQNDKTEEKKEENEKQDDQNEKPGMNFDNKKMRVLGTVFITIGSFFILGFVVTTIISAFFVDYVPPFGVTFVPIGVVMLVVGIILSKAPDIQKNSDISKMFYDAINQNNNKNSTQEKKPIVRCDYCGSVLEETDKRCPGCGARRKVKKD